MKLCLGQLLALVAAADAFVPSASCRSGAVVSVHRTPLRTSLSAEKNEGGKTTDTSETGDAPDPRKSVSAAPSFEEFLKFKQAERGVTPPAPAGRGRKKKSK